MIVLRRVFFGLLCIAAASAVLLASDTTKRKGKTWTIQLIEYANAGAIEETERGVITGLREAGLREGEDYRLVIRNAQGDLPTLNSLVDEALTRQADMVFTITTPALRVAMQKVRRAPIVFALALDPLLIGDSGTHEQHRPNVAGIYDRSPFERMMELIKETSPQAKRIGTLFAPGEANAVNFKEEQEKAAVAAGLEPIAVPVDAPADVPTAVLALLEKQVDVICQINDNLSGNTFASIVQAAHQNKVPLYVFSTSQLAEGAVYALANDHFDAGREAAAVAARIVRGERPASIPYKPESTVRLGVNLAAANVVGLTVPPEVVKRADLVLDEQGRQQAAKETGTGRLWNIHLVEYMNVSECEEAEQGFLAGLKAAGLEEGRDYRTTIGNAQGDIPTISALIDSALADRADMLVTFSTPTVQAAAEKVKDIPIVFTYLASAQAAGVASSDADHLPNVTGVRTELAYADLARTFKECMPEAKAAGTLFAPAELNTVFHKERLTEELQKLGLKLEVLPINTAADVPDAAAALCSKDIAALTQVGGNLPVAAFPSILEAARRAHLPVFSFLSNQAEQGAVLAVSKDYTDAGMQAAALAARIMRGESPAKIPIEPTRALKVVVNLKAAEEANLAIPDSVLSKATKVIR